MREGLWLSPTSRVLRALHLPRSWEVWVDRMRVVHDDVRDQRRQWILEALNMALILVLIPISLGAVIVYGPFSFETFLWMLSAPTVAVSWYQAIRGRAALMLAITMPMILIESTFIASNRPPLHISITTSLTIAFVIIFVSLTETIRATMLYSVMGVCCLIYMVVI